MSDFLNIAFIVILVVGIILVGLYYLNRWALKRSSKQNEIVEQTKQSASIFVIDKKRDKPESVNLPKAVIEQMPKYSKLMKMYFVKAKVGPQIVTLITEKQVFDSLPIKKNVKVEIAGIYIVSMQGMKSKEQLKIIKKAQKEAGKKAKKENK